jgi:YYY domain-containing protein
MEEKMQKKLGKIADSKYLRISMIILILALGAYFRFTGLKWDQDFHLHPDERFLTMVETSITPVASIREYFDTSASSLNPHNILDINGNQSYPFFVYGDLPIFLVRYIGEWVGMTGYGEIYLLGRFLSGLFDLGTILVIFFIANKLFNKFWLSTLAAFLYACAVLPIQIAHYFIVDNMTTFFAMAAFLAAVVVLKQEERDYSLIRPSNLFQWIGLNKKRLAPYVFFGLALGLAAASKINALALAVLLPLAVFLKNPKDFFKPASTGWTMRFHSMLLAAVISFITFRIFQPYAFQGPGFFNIAINKEWVSDLQELSVLSSGISNYPPSLQWARRSIGFPIKNLAVWGIGIPVAIFAFGGLAWMAWKIVKGKWQKYALIWIWTFGYAAWQTIRWNPTMRYFLLVYPTLAIIAAWCLVQTIKKINAISFFKIRSVLRSGLNTFLALILMGGAVCWSLAFIRIYQQPMTRIAASQWIYDHIEGAVNLELTDNTGDFIQALPYPHDATLNPGEVFSITFQPKMDGAIASLDFDHIVSEIYSNDQKTLAISIREKGSPDVLAEITVTDSFLPINDARGSQVHPELVEPLQVSSEKEYEISLSLPPETAALKFYGTMGVVLNQEGQQIRQAVFEATNVIDSGDHYDFFFTPKREATLSAITLFRVADLSATKNRTRISVSIWKDGEDAILSRSSSDFLLETDADYRGQNIQIKLSQSLNLEEGVHYGLRLTIDGENSKILISGSKPAKETDWDDTLPLYMYGLNPFDNYEGIYQSDLNFQMYWNDDEAKRSRFLSILDQADTIIMTSNRQWGSVTQLPEEFPLSTLFYKELIGCPLDDVQYCYRVAQPGMYQGNLGFELVEVFQSDPQIFGLDFNSQFAEEAFTVYDHPKVLVFKKTTDFSLTRAANILYSVDLDKIRNLNWAEAEKHAGSLMLSETTFNQQKTAGTWSEMFDYSAFQNRYPLASIVIWYLFITILGWAFYPTSRIVFRGLNDKGVPLLKLTGLILWALTVWWLGSSGVAVTQSIVLIALLGLVGFNTLLAWRNWSAIRAELRVNYKRFLGFELTALSFFLFFLAIRLGNPDLWHPYKGGEKPMDFSYFNAVLKSATFPPYDPWYAGGYINYYYYGFVLAAMPVKLLGIVPAIAYNLILPSFFSFTAMGAFSVGWNLHDSLNFGSQGQSRQKRTAWQEWIAKPFSLALASAVFVLLIGNLGTIVMIVQGLQKIAAAGLPLETSNMLQRTRLLFEGIGLFLKGKGFTYYPGDWYWIPSRAIPGEAITEFPYFTYLYGDPHAHLFAYPITLLGLCWILALLQNHLDQRKMLYTVLQLICGAVFIGSLKPTNTWDYPVFLFIAAIVLAYIMIRYRSVPEKFFNYFSTNLRKILWVLFIEAGFIAASYLLYYPFSAHYGQAYAAVNIWQGDHTPLSSYLTHWGFFLFIIYTFAVWEVHEWLAITPLTALKPFYERRRLIAFVMSIITLLIILLLIGGVQVVIVIALAAILLIFLIFRRDYQDLNRFVILISLAGLGLSLMVELIALRGDIGRMNTVFKFYLQAWTFLSLSSAYYFFRIVPQIFSQWHLNWRKAWQVMFCLLFFSVALFPLFASADKITDRMSKNVPLTLDGMEFMRTSTYQEGDSVMDLKQDYDAIRWMQTNVSGTPVIIEGYVSEYKWGSRYTVYTGLPGVIGWNWHQRQQRAINPDDWVYERINDVNEFYSTNDIQRCAEIIQTYDIDYIIVGQMEQAVYGREALVKFSEQSGKMWEQVYASQDTYIYRVKK